MGFESRSSSLTSFAPAGVSAPGSMHDFESKTLGTGLFIPAQLSADVTDELTRVAAALVREFEIEGLFYINSFVGADGTVTTFDVGTTVGLSERSYFPQAAKRDGVTLDELIWRTLDQSTLQEARNA